MSNRSEIAPTTARDQLLAAAIEHFAVHGIGHQSLRQIAAALDTNHRKLIYHFGSREGLLSAVVQAVEYQQKQLLAEILEDQSLTAEEAGLEFWKRLVGPVKTYGGLFFELSCQAMQDQPHARPLRETLVTLWLDPLTQLGLRAGLSWDLASRYARLSLATARGLFYDLLITNDQAAVDEALDLFIEGLTPGRLRELDPAP